MGRVAAKVEAALQKQIRSLGIVEATLARAQQAQDIPLRGRLRLEMADAHQVIELRMRHLHFQSRPDVRRRVRGSGMSFRLIAWR